MQSQNYKAIIIGCGSIGALKDSQYDSPSNPAQILTHAHAYYEHPDINLIGVIDSNLKKAEDAGFKWNCYGFQHIEKYMNVLSIRKEWDLSADIISVCVPIENHADILKQIIKLKPKLVIVEKPFCNNLREATEIAEIYRQVDIPILINYTRRFDLIGSRILNKIKDGEYGNIYYVSCLYGRGLKRDGCHAIDIFNWVLGKTLEWPPGWKSMGGGIIDYLSGDPSYNLNLRYAKCDFVKMVAVDSRKYGLFEIEFVTEKGIISFTKWGQHIHFSTPEPEKTYGQYQSLVRNKEFIASGLNMALYNMVQNAVDFLDKKAELKCTVEDALKVHKVIEEIV